MATETTIPLLTPYKMGPFELSHRVGYAPLTRSRALGTIPQPAAVTYYSQRATKGGFMLSEGTCISPEAHGYPNTPGIYTQEQIEAWKPIVKAVKEKGAIFFCQLWHVGRASHQEYMPNGGLPLAPSAIPVSDGEKVYISTGPADYPTPKALEKSEISTIVDEFRIAARNAMEAGFDGVEIHGANGYIIEEFIKDGTNKRTDEYGGSIENRGRFCREVVDAVVSEVGAQKVGIRFSPFSIFLDSKDSTPIETYLPIVEYANQKDLLYVHFVEPRVTGNADQEVPEGISLAPFRKVAKMTFLAAGGFKLETGNEAVKTGHADVIIYGRLFLSNPDLPKRFEFNAPLNKYDRASFYSPDQVVGYTDYPFLEETKA